MKNFLIKQYKADLKLRLKHNYLTEQFSDYRLIFNDISKLIERADYTLGEPVERFEKLFSKTVKSKFAIGVGSGTDAIFLSLKALGIDKGDEVITTPFTYIATVGAIVQTGAKPVFVDISDDCNIDENLIEKKIAKKTKAIVPVHWTGKMCDMFKIQKLAKKYNLKIVQDACHAINSKFYNKTPPNFGDTSCYSMHPLKNLNVWGDGGVIATNDITIHPHAHPRDTDRDTGGDSRRGFCTPIHTKLDAGGSHTGLRLRFGFQYGPSILWTGST